MAGKYYKSFEHLQKPDPEFGDPHVAKFISCIMQDGKRSTAQRCFYDALDIIRQRVPEREPLEVWKQAVENVKPLVEVRSRRVGGANYQVPVEGEREAAAHARLPLDPRGGARQEGAGPST